ncbi:MAG: Ig-like domain-containing protein, partial [Georgenia sp.]
MRRAGAPAPRRPDGSPRRRGADAGRRVVSLTVLAVVAAGVAAAALLDDDAARAEVDLNDGGVWVTSSTTLQVGRVNHQVHELDGAVTTTGADIDVLQDGAGVFVVDHGAASLDRVDVAGLSTSPVATLPPNAEVGLGGGVLALLDGGSGALRTASVEAPDALDESATEPQATLGIGAHIAVGADGTVHALSVATGELVTVPRGTEPVGRTDPGSVVVEGADPGTAAKDVPSEAPDLPTAGLGVDAATLAGATNQITAVGAEPVVLTRTAAGRLLVLRPGADPVDLTDLDLDTTAVRLQQVGPAADSVVLATADALVSVPLDGDAPSVIASPVLAPPVAPLVVDGCVHAAWAGGLPTYLRACEGSEPGVIPVPTDATAQEMRLRTNRGLVVLNDTLTGGVFLLDEQMTLVDDWDEVAPPSADDDSGAEPSTELTAAVPLEREAANRPPTATDDEFGVRPGGTTVLDVLTNDTDPDGDLLTITSIDGTSDAVGTVVPVLGGRALQVEVGPDAAGSVGLGYTVSDGRGGEASAMFDLTVVPREVNNAPVALRTSTLLLTAGASGSVDVLADVRDRDGDQLVLVGAAWDSDDVVRFTPAGVVTFEDSGVSAGPKQVVLTVSDGRATTDVVLEVDVRTGTGLPPTAVFDHARTTVGAELGVAPIHNDTDPDGDLLRLANVSGPPEVDVVADYGTGTFQVRSETAGTYYLTYVVVDDSGQSAAGLVRVDVLEPVSAAPVAMRDTALLPAGGTVTVDVLANDESPAGGLLGVQQVDVPQGSGLSVQVLEHRVLKISATQVPPGPLTLTYTVAGGGPSAQGEVLVQPVPTASQSQPPVAEPDVVNVRAGDVATVPVLVNDTHPTGLELRLAPDLVEAPDEPGSAFFTSGDELRVRAPATPQTMHAVYRVLDSAGNEDSAQVTVHVQADTGENSAPQPKPVETRAFAGERVRIPIALAGLDPDGDSVELIGTGEPPELGRIVEVGQGYLDYLAFDHATGTDTFTYLVRDRLGLVAAAPLRVGVVPAPGINRAPLPLPDTLEVRPGRTVEVDVLANDSDPDGDLLSLEDVTGPADGVGVAVADGVVQLTIDGQSGTSTVVYTVGDGRGETATGTLRVEVSAEAPLRPPTARDDLVAPAQIVGAAAVTVPVLANDEDADGTVGALQVSLPDAPAGAGVVGRSVRVPVLPGRQLITYVVTDPDGLTAQGFVDVPGLAETGPVLRAGAEPVEVRTGETVTIPLADHVVAPSGNPVRLTDAAAVQATNSDGAAAVVDAETLSYTSAAGYTGPASLTFEATDGATAQDGLRAVLTLPITVLPDGSNTAPTLTGASLRVAPADGANTLDLAPLTTDPDLADAGRHTYRVVEVPDGFEATFEGSFLTVTTAAATPPGTVGDVVVSVADAVADPVLGTVRAEVVTSTRPLAAVGDVDLGVVDQGEAVTVDVLA